MKIGIETQTGIDFWLQDIKVLNWLFLSRGYIILFTAVIVHSNNPHNSSRRGLSACLYRHSRKSSGAGTHAGSAVEEQGLRACRVLPAPAIQRQL